ncbi:MAG: stress response translation initiation inhibitor YciH [Myxococcota bacterium]|nr:stress response translation initiation inhibitor YciH [Myxococcota bacterium]
MSGGGDRTVWSDERGGAVGGSRSGSESKERPRGRKRERGVDRARKNAAADPADGVARVRREMKGRRGKPVTTISGLGLGEGALKELAGELKRRCGTGGSAKAGVIEIQGDHRDTILEALEERGIPAKRAGG